MVRPCALQSHCEFHLFKVGIKPMWEVKHIFHIQLINVNNFVNTLIFPPPIFRMNQMLEVANGYYEYAKG